MLYLLRQTYYDRHNNANRSNDSRNNSRKEIDYGKISSDVIRGYNDIIILYLLLSKPSYGYEISKEIKTLSEGKYIIKETTLYSAFTRMEKNGFIESFVDEDMAGGKKRTYYRITETGREHYRSKREEWTLTKEVIEKFIADEGALV